MPYIYERYKNGKITSFYTKNKSIKVGALLHPISSFYPPKEVVKVKFTKRDGQQYEKSNLH